MWVLVGEPHLHRDDGAVVFLFQNLQVAGDRRLLVEVKELHMPAQQKEPHKGIWISMRATPTPANLASTCTFTAKRKRKQKEKKTAEKKTAVV